jgi:3-oxoadipate enol-lactonase
MTETERRDHTFNCRLGRPLSYVEAGSGPDLVIVNAYGVSVKLWDRVVDRLARDYRVILWNMRGFVPDECDLKFTLADHADDMVEILDHAGVRRAHVLAYCSGTKVGLDGYSKLGDRVRSLSFVGGNFWPLEGYGPMNCRFATNLHKLGQMVKKRNFMAPIVVTMMTGKASALPMVAENLALISKEYRDLVVAPFASKGAVLTYADLVVNYYEVDTTPYLDRITVPTLVIGAGADAIVDPELSPAAAARIPGAEYVPVPEFNHFCMIEAPDALSDLVLGFLARIEEADAVASPVHGTA